MECGDLSPLSKARLVALNKPLTRQRTPQQTRPCDMRSVPEAVATGCLVQWANPNWFIVHHAESVKCNSQGQRP